MLPSPIQYGNPSAIGDRAFKGQVKNETIEMSSNPNYYCGHGVCACVCEVQRRTSGAFLDHTLPYSLEEESLDES